MTIKISKQYHFRFLNNERSKIPIFSFLLFQIQIQTIFSPHFPDKTTKDIGLVDGSFDLYDQGVGFRTYLKM